MIWVDVVRPCFLYIVTSSSALCSADDTLVNSGDSRRRCGDVYW